MCLLCYFSLACTIAYIGISMKLNKLLSKLICLGINFIMDIQNQQQNKPTTGRCCPTSNSPLRRSRSRRSSRIT